MIVTGAAWLPESAAAGASPRAFQLSIMGDPGVQVRGSCIVRDAGSDREVEIEGAVPLTRTMTGEDVACRFESDGYVVVELGSAGGRSRAATSGGTVLIGSGRARSSAPD